MNQLGWTKKSLWSIGTEMMQGSGLTKCIEKNIRHDGGWRSTQKRNIEEIDEENENNHKNHKKKRKNFLRLHFPDLLIFWLGNIWRLHKITEGIYLQFF